MIDKKGAIRWIVTRVNQLFSLTNSILTLQETGGSVTTDGTEQDVYRVETPMGVFEPVAVQINFSLQTAAETVVVRTYYRNIGGGALELEDEVAFVGVQDPELKTITLLPNRFGIWVSMERTAGGAFAYVWNVIYRS